MKNCCGNTSRLNVPSDAQPPVAAEVLHVCDVYTAVTLSCVRLWISTKPSLKGFRVPAGKRLTISEQSISKAPSGPRVKPLKALIGPVISTDSGPATAAFLAIHALAG